MSSPISVITSVTDDLDPGYGPKSPISFFRDVSFATYLRFHRVECDVRVVYGCPHSALKFGENDLEVSDCLIGYTGALVEKAELENKFKLGAFEDYYFNPLVRPLITSEREPFSKIFSESFQEVLVKAHAAARIERETGDDISPQGYEFYLRNNELVEFCNEAIDALVRRPNVEPLIERLFEEVL